MDNKVRLKYESKNVVNDIKIRELMSFIYNASVYYLKQNNRYPIPNLENPNIEKISSDITSSFFSHNSSGELILLDRYSKLLENSSSYFEFEYEMSRVVKNKISLIYKSEQTFS